MKSTFFVVLEWVKVFKDYDKYLTFSIKVYLFVLLVSFILKLIGLDYFGIEYNNPIIISINDFCLKYHLVDIFYLITMYIYASMFISITCNDNSKKNKIYVFLCIPVFYLISYLKMKYDNRLLFYLVDVLYLYVLSLIYMLLFKKKIKGSIRRYIFLILINTIYQLISLSVKNQNVNYDYNNFLVIFIMNIDYLIMVLITKKLYFMKGGSIICWEAADHSLFSLKKINLKKLLKKLQKNFQSNLKKFKKKSKQEKLSIIIYIILSIIWNTLTVLIILFMAFLNNTIVECIFILTSFWLSKGKFGKPFHFNSMKICFVVSNLSYYTLNRITTPVGISILIPILLGVGLSYVTSKFVKKSYSTLYRGMPSELFEETIVKVIDKDSINYKICKDFYINKENDLSLSFKYNYSVSGIRKIKTRINEKIKKLN